MSYRNGNVMVHDGDTLVRKGSSHLDMGIKFVGEWVTITKERYEQLLNAEDMVQETQQQLDQYKEQQDIDYDREV